jgi:3D (Asp-Asp-Asp) domain-containing protein
MRLRAIEILAMVWLAGVLAGACCVGPVAADDMSRLAAEHPHLPWPDARIPDHPLEPAIRGILSGQAGEQPPWKLPMLVNALQKKALAATITGYSSDCDDCGGLITRWGTPVRWGICAADPQYWGPGSVIWIGPPVNTVLIVEDTGGAVQGPHRFDVCCEGRAEMVAQIGTSQAVYVPLHRVAPRENWGVRPAGWHPPVWTTESDQ